MSVKSRLDEISIRSLGVIENSTIEFGPGLNVLTGETGAGKTMILTAIGLALGEKADAQIVRHGSGRCLVSATFSTAENQINSDFLDSGSLVLTRSISEDGKSKAIAGGVTVAASILAELGAELIEIHGQTANQKIAKSAHQRQLLDQFAVTEGAQLLQSYQEVFSRYLELKERIASFKKDFALREEKIIELEEFLNAGNRIKPKLGEFEELTNELSRLGSVEELRLAITVALQALDSEEGGGYTSLSTAKRAVDSVLGKDDGLNTISANLSESVIALSEALSDLRKYEEGLAADPARLDLLQNRRAELNALIKKYGKGSAGDEAIELIITRLKSARSEMNDLKGGEDRLIELENEMKALKKELVAAAQKLSGVRIKSAELMSARVTEEVQQLAMPHTNFRARVESVDYAGSLKESDFTALGCDEVIFEIQGHQGAPYLPIAKSASGGEMSRIMLALEVVLAQSQPVGTYIFDEVDAGVGGRAAIEVGRRLAQLASEAQVIVVTHLPQVAAWADTHFVIEKDSNGTVVSSGVRRIEGEERVEEIARMLAGIGESNSAREHAAELLQLRS